MTKASRIKQELDQIQQDHDGLLLPADVVEFARDESTALHARFDWDDTEAAEKWRLSQAGEIIRLNITITGEKDVAVRAFVSLSTDRAQGGGYRSIEAVMSSSDIMAVMLADALGELNVLRKKYAKLKALRPVWDAIERVESPPIRAAG